MEDFDALLALCEAHAAGPFEAFFGHAALALAQRDAGDAAGFASARVLARQAHAQLAAEEQRWCVAELAALDG